MKKLTPALIMAVALLSIIYAEMATYGFTHSAASDSLTGNTRNSGGSSDSLFESVEIYRGLEIDRRGKFGYFEVAVEASAWKTITVTVPTTPPTVYELDEDYPGEYEYEDEILGLMDQGELDKKFPPGNYVLRLYADARKRTLLEELTVVFDNALPFPEEYPELTRPAPMNWKVSADTRQTYEWNAYGGTPGTATHMIFSINDPDDDDEYAEYVALIDGTCSFTPHLAGDMVPAGNHEIQLAFICWKLIDNEKVPWIACFNERSAIYDVTVKAAGSGNSLFESVEIYRGLEMDRRGKFGYFEVAVEAAPRKTITVTVPTNPPTVYDLDNDYPGEYEYEDEILGLKDLAALNKKFPPGNYVLRLYAETHANGGWKRN